LRETRQSVGVTLLIRAGAVLFALVQNSDGF